MGLFVTRKKEVQFSMAIGYIRNEELMHKCLTKHLGIGTRMKRDKETQESKKRRVNIGRSTVVTKKIAVPTAYL